MTTQEFNRLSSRVRYLLLQYAVSHLLKKTSHRSSVIKFLKRNYLDLDHLEHNFSRRNRSPTFKEISALCDQCDPLHLATFPDQIDLVWAEFDSLVSAADLINSSIPLIRINPVIDEAIGLLQTQSIKVSNRFRALQAGGANIDVAAYVPLAKEASLAASVFKKRLFHGEDSISFDDIQQYKSWRRDTISSPANYFLEDLKGLRDYLLQLLRADPAFFA